MLRTGRRHVVHLLLARCGSGADQMRALEAAFQAAADDAEEPRVSRVSTLDLSAGPVVGRVRAAFGFGWQAREWVRRVEQVSGVAVDAVVEACPDGGHHLLGLGRLGRPTVRWAGDAAPQRWVDRLATQEGSLVVQTPGDERDPRHLVQACLDALDRAAAQLANGASKAPRTRGKP